MLNEFLIEVTSVLSQLVMNCKEFGVDKLQTHQYIQQLIPRFHFLSSKNAFSILPPAAVLWIGEKSRWKEVVQRPHVTGWAWCVWETFVVMERSWECSSLEAWLLDQAGQMHPNTRDISVTAESCTETAQKHHCALGERVWGSAGSGGEGGWGNQNEPHTGSRACLVSDNDNNNLIFSLHGWSSVVKPVMQWFIASAVNLWHGIRANNWFSPKESFLFWM